MPPGSAAARPSGFALLLLLLVIAAATGFAAWSVSLGTALSRREAEKELLAIGAEFEQAFATFRGQPGTAGTSAHPRSLEELLRDPRVPHLRRHLRRIYTDPITAAPWELVYAADGQTLIGVHSRSPDAPMQRTGFSSPWEDFEEAEHYTDWVFGLPQVERQRRVMAKMQATGHAPAASAPVLPGGAPASTRP